MSVPRHRGESPGGARVDAYRFVYGKVVGEPGGPAEPGFEHRPTSISSGLPACLIPHCRPQALLANRPVQSLIHASRTREGALLFWPAACEGKRYMLATCLRARPESGEEGLSRTYTQLVTYCFAEPVWCAEAPRLLANAERWLHAEPDTRAYHLAGDFPAAESLDDRLPEIPPCLAGPLPKPGTLLWRMAAAVEGGDDRMLVGPADRMDSVAHFLRALACVAALLPEPLRIHLTAAAGLAQPEASFALQYLPEAPALGATGPGLLEQLANELRAGEAPPGGALDLAAWQGFWKTQGRGDPQIGAMLDTLASPGDWDDGAGARAALAAGLEGLVARRSLQDLGAWLDGRRPDPPPRPGPDYPQIRADWVGTIAGRILDCLARNGSDRDRGKELARALTAVAGLADPAPSERGARPGRRAGQSEGSEGSWHSAWLAAARTRRGPVAIPGGPCLARPVLCWSALTDTPYGSDPEIPRALVPQTEPLGRIRDFSELRALREALRLARAESSETAADLDRALPTGALDARLKDLRARAERLLALRPTTLTDLAAAMPSLLAPPPGEDGVRAAGIRDSLRSIRLAALLCEGHEPAAVRGASALAEAARQVAARSFGADDGDRSPARTQPEPTLDEDLQALLRRYWQWSLAPDRERDADCGLWRGALAALVCLWSARRGAAEPLSALARVCRRTWEDLGEDHGGMTDRGRLQDAADRLFAACLSAVATAETDPVETAVGLLDAFRIIRRQLESDPWNELARQLADRLFPILCASVQATGARSGPLAERLLPLLAETLDEIRERPRGDSARLLDLSVLLLDRLLEGPVPPPRPATLALLVGLEGLIQRTPGSLTDSRLLGPIDRLATGFAHVLLAWAGADRPEPWLHAGELPPHPWAIRRRLAERLGFPRCVYFGSLTPPDGDSPEARLAGAVAPDGAPVRTADLLDLGADLAIPLERVLAVGAATAWRSLFERRRLAGQSDPLRRLTRDPATEEVLEAIGALVRRGRRDSGLIDEETRFTVSFFLDLEPTQQGALALPVPRAVRKALLKGASQGESYALELGRAIADGEWRLREVFERDDSNERFARHCLLLPCRGWDGLAALDDAARRDRMTRLLFAVALVIDRRSPGSAARGRLRLDRADLLRTLTLPHSPPVRELVAALFSRHRGLAPSLRWAIAAAGLNRLPGWPDAAQPDPDASVSKGLS